MSDERGDTDEMYADLARRFALAGKVSAACAVHTASQNRQEPPVNDDRLTPEERAVLDAAERRFDARSQAALEQANGLLTDAVAAYRRATAPPEPFEAFLNLHDEGDQYITTQPGCAAEVWRCTVTPTERVQ